MLKMAPAWLLKSPKMLAAKGLVWERKAVNRGRLTWDESDRDLEDSR